MPKSKRNKTVDLSKTKKHGLEGKKELYKKIQSNVENYAHVFVFAVNDMRNSKMKNVREQWKQSRFCIGKNRVMAMALGRTPEEEYRPNLHKIGQMLMGERGLFFTNQPIEEVTNWFESYSEGDFARSGNIATQDVILPEGPLPQFPHNLESYLRQLGLPTTLKKGVIHLVKEHVVCNEGDRLSPETARILKLLGFEMAEFRIKVLSVWCQDGSFINFHSSSCDSESKENVTNDQKSFMREDFELAKDCLLLGDDNEEMEAEVDTEDKNKISDNSEKDTESEKVSSDLKEESEELKVEKKSEDPKPQIRKGKKSFVEAKENAECDETLEDKIPPNLQEEESEKTKPNPAKKENKTKLKNKGKQTNEEKTESEGKDSEKFENEEKESSPTIALEVEDVEMDEVDVPEPEVKKSKSETTVKKPRKTTKKSVNVPAVEKTEQKGNKDVEAINEKVSGKDKLLDKAAILKLTEKKLEESAEKPKKFSPKLTRARAAAANIKVNEPKPLETKRTTRKRKM